MRVDDLIKKGEDILECTCIRINQFLLRINHCFTPCHVEK